jgi:hypothetical protein
MRTSVTALALVLASPALASAQPSQRCSHDTFSIGSRAVSVSACAPVGVTSGDVTVSETIAGGTSIGHETAIHVLAGAAVSRAVDDVDLAPLGLASTLHLTLAYADGKVSVEHALLLPGAIPLK